MTEKLKPEQRKIWRRIYLTAFEGGSTVEEAERMADRTVEQWEARGAFDEEPHYGSSPTTESNAQTHLTPHYHLRLRVACHDPEMRPSPGDELFCADDVLHGIGVVVSYRAVGNAELDVHVIAQDGNPNVGATWQFKKPRVGVAKSGTVVGESSHTHEPKSVHPSAA